MKNGKPSSPNHSANQNEGTTKMLPPFGEGHSSKENAAFPDITNTTCNRSNENAAFPDITNTACNRSNENARIPDTYSHSTNEHLEFPKTTKTMCYRSATQC